MKTKKTVCMMVLAGIAAMVPACMTNPNSSADFGDSTDNMVQRQTYNPGAAAVDPEASMAPMDGGAVDNVVTSYRESSQRQGDSVQNEIHINVGN